MISLRALAPETIRLLPANIRPAAASILDSAYQIQHPVAVQDASPSPCPIWLSSKATLSLRPMGFAWFRWLSSDRWSHFGKIDIKYSLAPDTSDRLGPHSWKTPISLDKVFPIERPNCHEWEVRRLAVFEESEMFDEIDWNWIWRKGIRAKDKPFLLYAFSCRWVPWTWRMAQL